jgi:hypothetical protein
MVVLEIQQSVDNFENWKKIFDSDPVDREKMKVRQYQICRITSDPNHVIISLLFADAADAAAMLEALQQLWTTMSDNIINDPKVRMLMVVESVSL